MVRPSSGRGAGAAGGGVRGLDPRDAAPVDATYLHALWERYGDALEDIVGPVFAPEGECLILALDQLKALYDIKRKAKK